MNLYEYLPNTAPRPVASAFIPTVIGWLPVVMTAISGPSFGTGELWRFSTAFEKDTTGMCGELLLALMERVFGPLLGMAGFVALICRAMDPRP